jgi:TfoX/Sxy family transcriptional regulator of competence genes
MSSELQWLRERLESAMSGLPGVAHKRMFGCDAFFREGTMFAMVWKEGRLAVKLPDDTAFAELKKVKGAAPWSPGGKMTMGSWLLVPASWNEDEDSLRPWVTRAHAQATPKAAKKKAAKKKA